MKQRAIFNSELEQNGSRENDKNTYFHILKRCCRKKFEIYDEMKQWSKERYAIVNRNEIAAAKTRKLHISIFEKKCCRKKKNLT